ncbi:hypothetical protein BB561_005498 [Smittium simulii]|uniref:Uncharacterized protein n=1 Tax=Smittium simulii TaxID=133385 RepID=A0A2T9YA24_9FUNG|nr:hypothetical protein BB561_005498 [Smittium simulii]
MSQQRSRIATTHTLEKELIYGSKKICGMNYNPPLINKYASSAVKMMNSSMSGIQSMLVNLTKPIGQYVHNKLRMEPNTDILNNRDLKHNLKMREMIADIAAHITQLRIEHVHKTIKFQEKVPQLMETPIRPLIEVKQMDMLVAAKKAEKRSAVRNTTRNRKPFHQRQQYTPEGSSSFTPAAAQSQEADTYANKGAGAENRSNKTANQPPSWRPSLNVQSSLVKAHRQPVGQEHCRKGVKNPIKTPQYVTANFGSFIKESDDQFERVFVANAPRCFNNFTRPKVNATPKPIQEENYIGSKKDSDNGSGNSSLKESHRRSKSKKSGVLQRKKLQDGVTTKIIPNHTQKRLHFVSGLRRCIYVYSDTSNMQEDSKSTYVYQNTETSNRMGTATKNQSISILRQSANYERNQEYMLEISDYSSTDNQTSENGYKHKKHAAQGTSIQGTGYVNSSATGTIDVETSPRIEKQFSRKIKTVDFAGCYNRTSNRKFNILEDTIESMERFVIYPGDARDGSIYKRQKHSLGNCSKLAVLLMLMKSTAGVAAYQRQVVINYIICPRAKKCGWLLCVSLFRQHYNFRTASNIRTVNNKSCRCSQQADGSNRMVNDSSDVYNTEQDIRNSRRGSICDLQECKNKELLQLMDQSILLPTVELDCTSYAKGETKKNIANNYNAVLENSNVVPRSYRAFNATASIATSNSSNSRSQKRKIAVLEKQTLALSGLEDQRRALKNQGLKDYAVDFIVSNKRRVQRRTRYSALQQRFLDRRLSNKIVGEIAAPQIINYLAEIYIADKLRSNTIRASKKINISQVVIEFFNTLNDASINPNSELSVKDLTTKLACLLAVTGMLRASNIHHIDDARSQIINGSLHLLIVAPKEKRGGQHIERPCQIMEHTNPSICPVKVYTEYKLRVAFTFCPTPHINNDLLIVNRLLRQLNNYSKPLAVDSITRYIQKLLILIARPDNTSVPKARAIGATLAASAGASTDDIVNHAFWSNYSIFDEYYRLL